MSRSKLKNNILLSVIAMTWGSMAWTSNAGAEDFRPDIASENSVTVGEEDNYNNVYGGYSSAASVFQNSVVVNGSLVKKNVYGAMGSALLIILW